MKTWLRGLVGALVISLPLVGLSGCGETATTPKADAKKTTPAPKKEEPKKEAGKAEPAAPADPAVPPATPPADSKKA